MSVAEDGNTTERYNAQVCGYMASQSRIQRRMVWTHPVEEHVSKYEFVDSLDAGLKHEDVVTNLKGAHLMGL